MADDDDSEDETVGYCRPPRQHQFKKGRSGNPRGRPRGSTNVDPVQKVLDRKVTVTERGVRRKLTAREALALQLVQKGLGGDRLAAKDALNLGGHHSAAPPRNPTAALPLGPAAPDICITVVAAEPDSVVGEALLALGICKRESRVSKLPTWWVVESLARLDSVACEQIDLKKLAALMEQPEDLEEVVRWAKRLRRGS